MNPSKSRSRQKRGHPACATSTGKWGKTQDWRLLADVKKQISRITIFFEDANKEAFERKKLKYADL